MPLPSSGTISTDDLNAELGNPSGSAIDLETAADSFGVVYLTDGTDPIEFDEFYGLSLDGFATFINNISPTSIVSSSAAGAEHTITYTSDGNFFINADSLDWVTPNIASGSSGSNQTFTLTTTQQDLDATSRSGTITLESPELSSYITYSIHQDDNDATLQISPQPIPTNVIAYGYQGGEDEYYKVETSPEEVVTWTATLSNTTDFSHREGSSGAFTTSAINGTGDAFIYVKGNANSSTSSLLTTTISVDPTNISDPTVTTTGTVNKYPYIELSGNEISYMGGNYVISSGFAYDDNTVSDGYTINVTSNYAMLSVGGASLSGTNANKFGISQSTFSFVVYPNSTNNSGGNYTATVTVTVNSDPNFSISFTVSQASANPPVLSGNPTSMTWAYNEILSSHEQTFTLGVTNNGNTINSVNIYYDPGIQDGRFKLVDYGTGDGGLTVTNQYGDVWNANVTNPSSSTFKVNVLPTAQNTGSADITGALSVNVGYSGGTIISSSMVSLTHEYQQLSAFTYADAGVSGFAVNRNTGLVTAPTNTAGTISSLSYSTGYSSGYYPVVTTSATRTVDVTVTVPSTGYSNSGGSVSGQESTTQLAALETISLSTSQGSPIGATGASFSVSVDVVDAWNTEWEASISYVSVGSVGDWVDINGTSTGTGDGTVTQITVDTNYTNGTYYQSQREFTITVQKPGGAVIDTLDFTQNSSSPPVTTPIIDITSPSGASPTLTFAHDDTNTSTEYQTITFGKSSTSDNETSATAKIEGSSNGGDKFKLISTNAQTTVTEQSTNVWVASFSTTPPATYTVGVIPQGTNSSGANFTGTVECRITNTAGFDSETVALVQQYYIPPSFTSADWTGVVSINRNTGAVSVTDGNSTATVSISPTSFALVTSTTSRTVTVSDVQVPSGYLNTGDTLADFDVSVSQLAATETITLTPSSGTRATAGEIFDISIDTVDVWNTSWEASISNVSTGVVGNWVSVLTGNETGTGDDTTTIELDSNYTNGTYYNSANGGQREFTVQVQKPGGAVIATATFTQNASAPPVVTPIVNVTSPTSLTFAYDDTDPNNSSHYQTITFGNSATSAETAASARIYGPSFGGSDFKLISTNSNTTISNVSSGYWVASFNNIPASSYTVGVVPINTNNGFADLTGSVDLILTNTAGTDTATVSLTQEYQTVWSVTPTSLSFTTSAQTKTVTLSSSYAWTAAITGTGMSVTPTSGNAGTSTLSVSSTANSGAPISGTLTISATGQSDLTVSTLQQGGDSNLEVSWNSGLTYNSGGQTTTTTLTNDSSTYREFEIYARQDYNANVTWSISQGGTYAQWVVSGTPTTSDQTSSVGTSAKKQILRVLANSSSNSVSFTVNVESAASLDLYDNTYTHSGTGSSGGGGGGAPQVPKV